MRDHDLCLPFHIRFRQDTVQVGGPDEVLTQLPDVAFSVRVLGGIKALPAQLLHDLRSGSLVDIAVN